MQLQMKPNIFLNILKQFENENEIYDALVKKQNNLPNMIPKVL